MPIRTLPPEVAVRIAAGEVIARPTDAVKELVENAIDACLSISTPPTDVPMYPPRISVEIRGGGLSLIRVVDTGCGIPANEAALAFGRHTTSKIASADDLFSVRTLGFRGEALASLAAVSQVTLYTRRSSDDTGAQVSFIEGRLAEEQTWAGPSGTTVTLRGLFRSTPARLRFLRNAASEAGQIAHLLGVYALAYPEISFSLVNEGRSVLQSSGSGDLRDALIAVYDLRLFDRLLPVQSASDAPSVSGYVSQPDYSRPTRSHLTFLVNRRWVRSRTLAYAVEQAYHPSLATGRHPVAVLNLDMPPSEVDVNVHPTKAEVRFVNDRGVFSTVQRAVREALLVTAPIPTIAGGLAPFGREVATRDTTETSQSDFTHALEPTGTPAHRAHGDYPIGREAPEEPRLGLPILHPIGQVQRTYIVAEGPDGVYFVDQHTAHERVRYEEIVTQRRSGSIGSQELLEPVVVEIDPRQSERMTERSAYIRELGFAFEAFGERAYLVRAVPAILRAGDAGKAFTDLVDSLTDDPPAEGIDPTIAVLACHSAVRAGDSLTLVEMRELVYRLEGVDIWRYCPHGRPIVVRLDSAQLARDFRR